MSSTPRPVVKFMVDVTDPQLRRDCAACGTGASWKLTTTSPPGAVRRRPSQVRRSHSSGRAKSSCPTCCADEPSSAGLEYPNIKYGNTLMVKVTELATMTA